METFFVLAPGLGGYLLPQTPFPTFPVINPVLTKRIDEY
jgi:hypothetical protein